jgi:hypothetical protein
MLMLPTLISRSVTPTSVAPPGPAAPGFGEGAGAAPGTAFADPVAGAGLIVADPAGEAGAALNVGAEALVAEAGVLPAASRGVVADEDEPPVWAVDVPAAGAASCGWVGFAGVVTMLASGGEDVVSVRAAFERGGEASLDELPEQAPISMAAPAMTTTTLVLFVGVDWNIALPLWRRRYWRVELRDKAVTTAGEVR